ncbi:oxygenase MpaB family protein [Neorhizobium sp. NPDC001467]|uniref:oxygenase MpaB family protein n=1 Tax=Neorhizobium sp. NPDC001467 TaxID=3390595 RepID=UPI003D03995B
MFHRSHTLPLPAPLHDRLDRAAIGLLGNRGPKIDFSQPRGEPALVPADSVSWIVFKNQISMFIGGVAAVLLEFAEPKVRDGVWQHSSFRSDALTRLQRTGLAAMVTVYGARSQAEAMIAGVVRRHSKVEGITSGGEDYHANDQELLDWVQTTAGFGFMEAYHRYVRALSLEERDALFREAEPAARLYGAVGAPKSQAELEALFASKRDRLEPSPIVEEFLTIMRDVPALPGPVRPLQGLLVKAAVEILPHWIRNRLALGKEWSLGRLEHATVALAARSADRLLLRSLPPAQACRRLGLPDDYLYRPLAALRA